MDNELSQLEAELARLRPAPPSRALVRRIEAELATAETRRAFSWYDWVLAAALPAAAIMVLVLTQLPTGDESRTPAEAKTSPAAETPAMAISDETLKPVTAEKLLVSANDEGLVILADGTPARRARLHFVDTITWRHPRTNASLTWTVPREEVRVVPVAFQ